MLGWGGGRLAALTASFAVVLAMLVSAPASGADRVSAPAAVTAPALIGGPALRAPVVGFQAGNIISDSVFFARGTMSASAIQSFLNARVPSCQSGYTCLKDFAMATTDRSADAMCTSPYTGRSRETAAEIVYNVAQACGINPQVILATLEKEQGLVSHTWPSDWRYTIAMGQGCPDTAACDTRYYGFFNQVYGAAWQFKRYANPPGTSQYFTWYAPGGTWNIGYHPNAACGSSPVRIANQATAALYYYTPYQPNAAALAAGSGTGDGCSSYGNRNFYNYFTAWFGSTQGGVGTAIVDAYASLGGSSGRLGAAVGPTRCGLAGGGCYQDYTGGKIHWSGASGAHATWGAILGSWSANGFENGALGYPTTDEACGLPANGCYQEFQGGKIHWSPATDAHATKGAVLSEWASTQYERGWLGFPVSDEQCGLSGGGCYQDFQGGKIHWSPATGAHGTHGGILARWSALGFERGVLGYPTTDEGCGLPAGGCYQAFAKGMIYWTGPTGAQAVRGAILSAWAAQGSERGPAGYPLGEESCSAGVCQQAFQHALVRWSSDRGARIVDGPILDAWAAQGYVSGPLGASTGDKNCGLPKDGCYIDLTGGKIYWNPAAGAHAVSGQLLAAWAAQRYERGPLGYPTSDATCAQGVCVQGFEGGTLTASSAGVFPMKGAILSAWQDAGGPAGRLGGPTGPEACGLVGGGCYQDFQAGKIHWSPATGAFATRDAVLAAWAAQGYERGPAGYPVAAETCAADGRCVQRFEHATLP